MMLDLRIIENIVKIIIKKTNVIKLNTMKLKKSLTKQKMIIIN